MVATSNSSIFYKIFYCTLLYNSTIWHLDFDYAMANLFVARAVIMCIAFISNNYFLVFQRLIPSSWCQTFSLFLSFSPSLTLLFEILYLRNYNFCWWPLPFLFCSIRSPFFLPNKFEWYLLPNGDKSMKLYALHKLCQEKCCNEEHCHVQNIKYRHHSLSFACSLKSELETPCFRLLASG